MNASWKLGTIGGIVIRVHWTMLILLAWIGATNLTGGGLGTALFNVGIVAMIFSFVVLHELGHAITAEYFGIQTRDITLLPIGGVARLKKIPENPRQEILVAIAGPAVNIIIAGAFALVKLILNLTDISLTDSNPIAFVLNLGLFVNLAMAFFNLLPAFPMDGGRVLRALLVERYGYVNATKTAALIGQSMAIALGLVGLFANGMLIFIAMFVFLGAEQESLMVQAHVLLSGVPVHEAMRTRLLILNPHDDVSSALNEFTAGNQHDFPVIGHDRQLCGMVYRNDLLKALGEGATSTNVDRIMHRDFTTVQEDSSLELILESMNENESKVMPVMRGHTVVGLISMENIGEWLMLHLRQATTNPTTPPRSASLTKLTSCANSF